VSVAGGAAGQDGGWSVAMTARPSDGHRIVYRYRSKFGPGFQRAAYPDRVTIAWPYDSDDGMPSKQEREAMERMEKALEPWAGEGPQAVLVLVSTGDGLREWVYYARSQQAFMDTLNEALKHLPPLPIQIDLWKDAQWKRYDEFRRALKE
jgi:hypothetical protein